MTKTRNVAAYLYAGGNRRRMAVISIGPMYVNIEQDNNIVRLTHEQAASLMAFLSGEIDDNGQLIHPVHTED